MHARVGGGRRVQTVDGARVRLHLGLRLQHAAVEEGVVDSDDAAHSQQLEAGLVVGGVALLVGVDEGEVVRARLASGYQRLRTGGTGGGRGALV